MSLLAKSKGEVTYKELSTLHKWALVVLISMGSSIIYAPMYLKNVFYDPLMQALGATNADLGLMVSAYGIAAMICYLPSWPTSSACARWHGSVSSPPPFSCSCTPCCLPCRSA